MYNTSTGLYFSPQTYKKVESKKVHELGQFLTIFNYFGVIRKHGISAFQRHQNPLDIGSFNAPFFICPPNRSILIDFDNRGVVGEP